MGHPGSHVDTHWAARLNDMRPVPFASVVRSHTDVVRAGAPGRIFVQQNANKTEKSLSILCQENTAMLTSGGEQMFPVNSPLFKNRSVKIGRGQYVTIRAAPTLGLKCGNVFVFGESAFAEFYASH